MRLIIPYKVAVNNSRIYCKFLAETRKQSTKNRGTMPILSRLRDLISHILGQVNENEAPTLVDLDVVQPPNKEGSNMVIWIGVMGCF